MRERGVFGRYHGRGRVDATEGGSGAEAQGYRGVPRRAGDCAITPRAGRHARARGCARDAPAARVPPGSRGSAGSISRGVPHGTFRPRRSHAHVATKDDQERGQAGDGHGCRAV